MSELQKIGVVGQHTYIFEYIWTDNKENVRSKTKIFRTNDLIGSFSAPKWVYDGSSTGQAVTKNSEVVLKPVEMYKDPFRDSAFAYLVLCETELPDGKPHPDNYRRRCSEYMNRFQDEKPLFGYEQEFFIINTKTDAPIIYTNEKRHACIDTKESGQYNTSLQKSVIVNGSNTQEPFYCGVGSDSVGYRNVINQAVDNCLAADLSITGMNFEVAPGQCAQGIHASDQLIMLRYILQRTLEPYGLYADFRTKPKGLLDPPEGKRFNASGCHTNFSTAAMRKPGGLSVIQETIEAFGRKHSEHMNEYGPGNMERLTGANETSAYNEFSFGVANRSASIRIPLQVKLDGCGYFEDRRPSSAMNPYRVSYRMFKTYIERDQI